MTEEVVRFFGLAGALWGCCVTVGCTSGAVGNPHTPSGDGEQGQAGDSVADSAGDRTSDASGAGDQDSGDGASTCLDIDADGVCHAVDCDDTDPAIPSAAEVCGNALDDNCNSEVDEGCLESATPRYVDKDSTGGPCADANPGTLALPWCSIAKANQALVAGQTVFIRAGVYNETINPSSTGTSETQRIAYAGFPGETVTITGVSYGIRLEGKSYVTVVGIEVVDCISLHLFISASKSASSINTRSVAIVSLPPRPARGGGDSVTPLLGLPTLQCARGAL